MRFLFIGNTSAPEWFLAECAILSKITAIKLKVVTGYLIDHLIDDVDNAIKII
jgi:hypothetical protein